jgi:anti-anti-sigma regulatory factor
MDLAMERDDSVEGLTILIVKGGLDRYNTSLLRHYLIDLLSIDGAKLAVDLTETRFIGETGRQALVDGREERARRGGFLCLIDPPGAWDARGHGFVTYRSRKEAIEQLAHPKPQP